MAKKWTGRPTTIINKKGRTVKNTKLARKRASKARKRR